MNHYIHSLNGEPKEEIVTALEAYIRSLKPVPSPRLANGKLSPAALQGQKVFAKSGCADCHPAPLFTDLNAYDVGTLGPHDKPTDKFGTPTLVEIWRTAPYLHDGSAETIREALNFSPARVINIPAQKRAVVPRFGANGKIQTDERQPG